MQQLNDSERIFRERSACAKHDLIGTICNSEIIHLLGLDSVDTREMREAWNQIEDYLQSNVDKRVQGAISEMITSFGNCQEEKGFKDGFHIATRLFMEGMRGGVVL